VDSRNQVQLEKDEGGSTEDSWMKKNGLWPMFYQEPRGPSQLGLSKSISSEK